MKLAQVFRQAAVWLHRKRNPLMRDPQYAGLHHLEADMRRKHMPVAEVSRAKQDRLHQMLRGA